jgi:hypothetical protein
MTFLARWLEENQEVDVLLDCCDLPSTLVCSSLNWDNATKSIGMALAA